MANKAKFIYRLLKVPYEQELSGYDNGEDVYINKYEEIYNIINNIIIDTTTSSIGNNFNFGFTDNEYQPAQFIRVDDIGYNGPPELINRLFERFIELSAPSSDRSYDSYTHYGDKIYDWYSDTIIKKNTRNYEYEIIFEAQSYGTTITFDTNEPLTHTDFFEIENIEEEKPIESDPITLDNISISSSTSNKQRNVRYYFYMSNEQYPVNILSPIEKTINYPYDAWVEYDRFPQNQQELRISDISGEDSIMLPRVDIYEIDQINTYPTTTNGTIEIITKITETDLPDGRRISLEYQLDDGLWQTPQTNNNVYIFEDISPGEHTIRVIDQYFRMFTQTVQLDQIEELDNGVYDLNVGGGSSEMPINIYLRNYDDNSLVDTKTLNTAGSIVSFRDVDLLFEDSILNAKKYVVDAYDSINNNVTNNITNYFWAFDWVITTICVDHNDKYMIGGNFTEYVTKDTTSNRMIRLDQDGNVDNTFNIGSGFDDIVNIIMEDHNNKYIVGGDFNNFNETSSNRIVRLDQDGSIDDTFDIGTGFINGVVNYIIEDHNNKYIVGGDFIEYNGVNVNRIIRLNQDGSIDDTFDIGSGFNYGVYSIIEDSNNKYVVGGSFTDYSGTTSSGIIRLNQDGSIDDTFDIGSGFNSGVYSIIEDSNNKYVVGGSFTEYSGTTSNGIIRLNQDGSVDDTFNIGTGFIGNIRSIIEVNENTNKYVIGGDFTEYNSLLTNNIVKINIDGSVDNYFNPGNGFNDLNDNYTVVNSIIKHNKYNKYIIGGDFKKYDQAPAFNFCIINLRGTPQFLI